MITSDDVITLEDALQLSKSASVGLYREHVNPGLCTLLGIIGFDRRFVEAHGTTVVDDRGVEYLDFLGGYGALSFGHNHPEIVAAVHAVENMPNLLQASIGCLVGPLGMSLAAILPGELKRSFFCNSGAEAVEGALKLARVATGRTDFVYADGSFHGKSFGALSVTGRSKYQEPFAPLVPGCHRVGFGDVDALGRALADHECAAFIIEPIQGEGGYIIPPPDFFPALRKLCDKYGILLIADEVQSGMGRTGKWWAIENFGVEPDIITSAKGIASGMPLGAMITRKEIMDWPKGSHGNTFGGNPVCCAASLATIDLIEKQYLQNTREVGEYTLDSLAEIMARHPSIGDVRGIGLMIGVEFVMDKDSKTPAVALRDDIINLAFERGLLTLGCGKSTIRIAPPLSTSKSEVDEALVIFEEAITLAEAKHL